MGEDAPQVLVDLLKFMLAPLSITDAEYALWSPGETYFNRLKVELDYEEFNCTHLMPSFTVEVCALSSVFFPFLLSSFAFLYMVTFLKYLYHDGLAPSIRIDPSHLPWMVCTYGFDGFAL